MKKLILFLTLLVFAITSFTLASRIDDDTSEEKALKSVESTKKNVQQDEGVIAFNTMMDVLTHKRCVNCHPSDNVPKQGEDQHAHRFGITRENGMVGTNCNTCHQASNNEYSGVPGAPEWSLAPHNMRWEGLSRIEIAKSMMNPENNGNRTAEDVMHHLTEHELVLWAWEPGVDAEGNPREKPPVSKEDYITAVKKWIELGAVIPE